MKEEKKLSKKYQKIDAQEATLGKAADASENDNKKAKSAKEKKVKEPKPPKEKKAKEPKPPKDKKVKNPKPPKDKKVKNPNPPKEKWFRKSNEKKDMAVDNGSSEVLVAAEELSISVDTAAEHSSEEPTADNIKASAVVRENELDSINREHTGRDAESAVPFSNDFSGEHVREEIVLPAIKYVKKEKSVKQKKEKRPKEKKAKEPKAPKEKKNKESKPPKEKKVKEPKPVKEKQPKEKKPREPFKLKDYLTIAVAVLAILLAGGYFGLKYYTENYKLPTEPDGESTVEGVVADIKTASGGVLTQLIQSDIPDLFYGFNYKYEVEFYQYRANEMTPVQDVKTIDLKIPMGGQTIPATLRYTEIGGKKFGIGVFRSDSATNEYFYNLIVFKMTELPTAFAADGKVLLLASTENEALEKGDILWSESFVLDTASGATERFLKVTNRTIDMNGTGDKDFCILTKEGYTVESTFIPFITSREYDEDGRQDIYIKSGATESLYISDIYGKFMLTDGISVIYMTKTATGFDVMRKTNETVEKVHSFYGSINSDYMLSGEYLLNINEGKVYNLKTNEEKTLVGYRISPDMFSVSPDGRYIVITGTVQSVIDYQIHVFDLEKGEYMKYVDKNYSSHSNLTFINNTLAVYTALDPTQGYEYAVLDMAKAVQ